MKKFNFLIITAGLLVCFSGFADEPTKEVLVDSTTNYLSPFVDVKKVKPDVIEALSDLSLTAETKDAPIKEPPTKISEKTSVFYRRSLIETESGQLIGVSAKVGGKVLASLTGNLIQILSGNANVNFAWQPSKKVLIEVGPEVAVTNIEKHEAKNIDGTIAHVPAQTQLYVGGSVGIKFQ